MKNPVRHSIIVAMSENRIIGRDGGMPWHLPGDLKYFKKTTMSKPIVMGRRTYESIGKPLPGRLNIVITRGQSYSPEGVTTVHTLEDAIAIGDRQAQQDGVNEVMIVGGGQIYAESLIITDRVYLTEIHASIDGDTMFPELSPHEWREISRTNSVDGELSDPQCSFVILDRVHR